MEDLILSGALLFLSICAGLCRVFIDTRQDKPWPKALDEDEPEEVDDED